MYSNTKNSCFLSLNKWEKSIEFGKRKIFFLPLLTKYFFSNKYLVISDTTLFNKTLLILCSNGSTVNIITIIFCCVVGTIIDRRQLKVLLYTTYLVFWALLSSILYIPTTYSIQPWVPAFCGAIRASMFRY